MPEHVTDENLHVAAHMQRLDRLDKETDPASKIDILIADLKTLESVELDVDTSNERREDAVEAYKVLRDRLKADELAREASKLVDELIDGISDPDVRIQAYADLHNAGMANAVERAAKEYIFMADAHDRDPLEMLEQLESKLSTENIDS